VTPLGHAAVAFLTARGLSLSRRATGLCLLGAALPDLIDKPLVALGVVEVAHTVGHSVLVVGALGVGVAILSLERGWPLLAGWIGHVAADLVVAYPRFLRNYAWPVLAPQPTPDDPIVAYWLEYASGPLFGLEVGLAGLAVWLCWHRRETA
jgi:hypothetical protein